MMVRDEDTFVDDRSILRHCVVGPRSQVSA